MAVSQGLITTEELREAQQLHDRQLRRGEFRPVSDILIELKSLTPRQFTRLSDQLVHTSRIGPIPGYQLIGEIGKGAMGVVHKALQQSVDRVVAVKILSRHLSRNKDYINILDREAKLGARLCCEHIPSIIERGEIHGQHFLVMEYVEGIAVSDRLKSGMALSEAETLAIAVALTRALAHLHLEQIVHRDVKPANVVITETENIKLMDLGLARHTQEWRRIEAETGTAIGTPYYISPEQIRGVRDLDYRSDLYSLGASLYHMITGSPPFMDGPSVKILNAHLNDNPAPPQDLNQTISPAFNQIILQLLAKAPTQRYNNTRTLQVDLDGLQKRVATQ